MNPKFDSNQIAARIVAQATQGEFAPIPQERPKNRAAVSLVSDRLWEMTDVVKMMDSMASKIAA